MSTPQMLYRSNRPRSSPPTDLELYGESNMLSLFRHYMPMTDYTNPNAVRPNHDFGPMIESAVRVSEKLDLFDNNEGLLDEVIFGIVCPDLCHEGVRDFVHDRELVALLLFRHFKKFGGLVLPPHPEVRDMQAAHEDVVRADVTVGRQRTVMRYPNWRQNQRGANAFGRLIATRGSPLRGCSGGFASRGRWRGILRGGYGGIA